jgi:hypothetical protein
MPVFAAKPVPEHRLAINQFFIADLHRPVSAFDTSGVCFCPGAAGFEARQPADSLINLYQKPVKRSVYGLFAFWGLSSLLSFYPILQLLPVSNS